MESTIYIFIVVYLLGDITSIYLPKTKKKCIFLLAKESSRYENVKGLGLKEDFNNLKK